MKVIAQRFWNEPAVVIGAIVSVALLILAITQNDFDAGTIAGIAAPFASSIGIRQLVTPAQKESVGRGV